MTPPLSILICTIESRSERFAALLADLKDQCKGTAVEILYACDKGLMNGGATRGAKRQALLKAAKGDFIVFRDDDDPCPPDYVESILPHCVDGVDCIGHRFDCYGYAPFGKMETAIVSNRYKAWRTNKHDQPKYERCPHHLVPIRREHALKAGFDPAKDNGEDYGYSMKLLKLGLLKKEAFIDKVLYTIHHNATKKAGT